MAENKALRTQTITRKPLQFKECKCGCECYTAQGLRNYYSIFSSPTGMHSLRINDGIFKECGSYESAKEAAEKNEDNAFADYNK